MFRDARIAAELARTCVGPCSKRSHRRCFRVVKDDDATVVRAADGRLVRITVWTLGATDQVALTDLDVSELAPLGLERFAPRPPAPPTADGHADTRAVADRLREAGIRSPCDLDRYAHRHGISRADALRQLGGIEALTAMARLAR